MKKGFLEGLNLGRKDVKNMKKWSVVFLASLLVLAFSVPVWSYPMPVDWKMKFENVEVITPEPYPGYTDVVQKYFPAGGNTIEDNWGLTKITSIIDRPTNTTVWSDGDNGEYIVGIFWGLANEWTVAIDTDADNVHDSFQGYMQTAGSTMDGTTMPDLDGDGNPDAGLSVWLNDGSTSFGDAIGPPCTGRTDDGKADTYPGITYGTKQADFIFKPGIYAPDGTIITRVFTDAYTTPMTGDGTGYLDVVPGSGPLADIIIQDIFPTAWGWRDTFLEFDFRPAESPRDVCWDLDSDDPHIGSVPEPCTLLLLGSGLLGCGWGLRRKKLKS